MTRPKYTKPDRNQKEIVEELRQLGFDVDIVCDLPGLYDIVVSGERHVWHGYALIASLHCSLRVELKSKGGAPTEAEITEIVDPYEITSRGLKILPQAKPLILTKSKIREILLQL